MQKAHQKVPGSNDSKHGASKRRMISGRGLSSYSLFLRACKECGVPYSISRDQKWEEHGRILSRDSAQRLIIVERQIIAGILEMVASKMGGETRSLFREAKAFDASHYVRSLMTGWKKVAAGYPVFRRPSYELLCDHARILGLADARVTEYKRGSLLTVVCTHCYSREFFAGDILGAIYAVENREADIAVEEADGAYSFRAQYLETGGSGPVDKYSFSWEVPLTGHITYRRCKRCHIPFAVSFFSWNPEKGTMMDTHNGQQVGLVNVAGINIIYEELRASQGEWIDDYLLNSLKAMVDQILPGLEWKDRRPEERIKDLFFLAYRGMGNPVFTEKISDGIRARVENPFNYPMVAGIASSFLARGKPVHVEWERSMPGRLEIYVHFV